jgi:hypothetical protein
MRLRKLLILLLLGTTLSPAYGEIYKYVDEEGRVTYSNIPRKGARKLDLEPASSVPGRKRVDAAPTNFPSVDGDTQRKRDELRKKLLSEELSAEQQRLADARQALKEGEAARQGPEARNYQKYVERVQGLKEAVTLHEKNIESLNKELAGLR